MITLGCAKNEVDSEYMLADLLREGFEPVGDLSTAEAVVVNTCAFIEPAREEAVETILEAARLKESGACRVLAVVGCMAQRYREELAESLPEVDLFIGVGQEQRSLPQQLRKCLGLAAAAPCELPAPPRLVETTSQGWAYLKISEGCNNRCSYCAIPLIRGSLASRSAESIVQEARFLEAQGAKELVLIAQDVTAWGLDAEQQAGGITGLLEKLLAATSVPWIRLLYTHPAHLDESLLALIGAESRIVSYLDLPVQHASDRVLKGMGRGVTGEQLLDRIELARRLIDSPVLRTTVMVGFPGESKGDFERLLEFIAAVRFDRLGAFVYSVEEGTAAATRRDSVSKREKQRRLEEVMELQREISAELNQARVGRTVPVLVERPVDEDDSPGEQYSWAGRSQAHAPDVDGQVFFAGPAAGATSSSPIAPGQIIPVTITASDDYDLFGEPARE
jgi:ribosomal protein S12 methylthiotransferase